MHRIDNSTASPTQPPLEPVGVNSNGFFRNEDIVLGYQATKIDYSWLNSYQEELCNVILGAGITLNKASQNQLYTAIQTLINNKVNSVDSSVMKTIIQNGHGFIEGEQLYFNGVNWIRAIGTALSTSWTVGMVTAVESTAIFKVIMLGYFENVPGLAQLSPGVTYYLSTTIAGGIQSNRPNVDGLIIKPLFIADTISSGYFFNWLPSMVGETGDGGGTGDMLAANNLSDLENIIAARSNLELGTAALNSVDDFLQAANNLSDLNDAAVARNNLELGTAAIADVDDFVSFGDLGNYQPLATVLTNTTASFTTAQETKLNGIEALADVTDTGNVLSSLDGAGLTAVVAALDDKVLIQDTSDASKVKSISVQSIVDLGGGGETIDPIVRLAGGTISGVTELIIKNLSADYIKYRIIFSDVIAGTTAIILNMQLSTDNGASFIGSSGYTSRIQISNSDEAGNVQQTSATSGDMQLIRDLTNGAGRSQSGFTDILNPMQATSRTTIITRAGGIDTNGDSLLQDAMVQRDNAESNNAIRIYPSSSTFTMRYVIYGYLA